MRIINFRILIDNVLIKLINNVLIKLKKNILDFT